MIEFRVRNKKNGLFKYAPVMTNLDVIELIVSLSQYTFNENAEGFDRYRFYNDTLDNTMPYILGREEENVWGFKISYDKNKNDYVITVVDLATEKDWKLAIIYLRALSEKMGNPIISAGRKYTLDSIVKYDYETYLKFNLNAIIPRLAEQNYIFYPIKRPMVFGPEVHKILVHSQDKIKAYEEIAMKTQYPNAYVYNQTFHFYNGSNKLIYGNYSISNDRKCVLPKDPFIEYVNESILVGRKFSHWSLYIVFDEEGEFKTHALVEYRSFIENLEPNQYEWLDDNFIILKKLSKEELAQIAEKCKRLDLDK